MQNRLAEIDNAKALGIILVVLGHIVSPSYYLSNLIFAFQVPLFFALSGYLLSGRKLNTGAGAFVRHAAHRLLLPYLLFGVILFLPWFLVFRHFGAGAEIPAFKPLIGIAYGLGTDGWLQQSPPLWFLPALFIAMVITFAIYRQRTELHWPLALLAASLGLLASLSPVKFPLSSANALLAVPFMLLGVQWRANAYPLRPTGLKTYIAMLVGAGALLALVVLNGNADFNAMRFGTYGLPLYLPAALLGIALTVALAALLPASRMAQTISTGTLYILVLHIPLFTVIKGAALKLLHVPTIEWSTSPILILTITTLAIGMSLAVQYAVSYALGLLNRKRG